MDLNTRLITNAANGAAIDTSLTEMLGADPAASRALIGAEGAADIPTLDQLSIHGADIASAGTINLETATGTLLDVTGTTTITAITLSNGHRRIVRFTGALTLTNGASLVLPGGANITTAAGDFAVFAGYASSVVRCVEYVKATGKAIIPPAFSEVTSTLAATQLAGGFAKHILLAGGTAGDFTATGIKTGDELDEVIYFVGAGTAVTDVSDLTSEFAITGADTINNTGGTTSTGGKLLVRWTKKTA